MTEANQSDQQSADESSDTSIRSKIPLSRSRRRFLEQLAVGGSILVAGCDQLESPTDTPAGTPTVTSAGTPETSPTPAVINQTLRVPIPDNPAKVSYYGQHSPFGSETDQLFGAGFEKPSGGLRKIIQEKGTWATELNPGGKTFYNWVEKPIKITPNEVTVNIRDDARWSDGHKITGKDIAVRPFQKHIGGSPPPYVTGGEKEPETVNAFDDFEISEQSVTYKSSAGYFDGIWDVSLRTGTGYGVREIYLPTHIEPYDAYADALIDTVRRAQQGEVNPWKEGSKVSRPALEKKHLVDKKYVEKFSKPGNILASGAWDPVEFRGEQELVFKKNEHHRNADSINFNTLILASTTSDRRERASLQADRLDYAALEPTPQYIVDAFPDNITQLLIPSGFGSGNDLGLKWDHPAMDFGNRKVRVALMYALDQETIANNIHASAAEPITTPGGDSRGATNYVSQDWIDKNLTTYNTDLEKAADLLREVGYTRDGGQWMDTDGEPITLTLATKSTSPIWESTVASQLSQFGIPTSLQTFSEETKAFTERVRSGEFPMWAESFPSLSNKASATMIVWWQAAHRAEKWGYYPKEQYEKVKGKMSRFNTSKETLRVFTVKAPPFGKPKASLKTHHPAWFYRMFWVTPTEEVWQRNVKMSIWLANWLVPSIPINKTLEQHFIDDAHWLWPKEIPLWKNFTEGSFGADFATTLAGGYTRANNENPE